jgi:1-aminocyclopropane-1-carboxylate deaminase/D-cysteine desulfhydrase-like pyridoxal-dependent ACC family enzyme
MTRGPAWYADAVRLLPTPTAVEPLSGLPLWIKRDDRILEPYGGNKVRKLERFLGDARAKGKTRLLTLGAAGSHQLVAASIYGRAEGFEVEAVVVPQPATAHARRNLRIALGHGLRAVAVPAWSLGPAVLAARRGRDAYVIPLGGSNVIGALAFASAARELEAQVRRGDLPEPDVIVVALGSGGTAAGLAVGLEQAGMRSRVVGVAISHPTPVLSVLATRLARATARRCGASTKAALRLAVDRRWVGRGYGHPTAEGEAAVREAAARGIDLDSTYTGKAFACALALAREGKQVLFWHTLSTFPIEPLLAGAPVALPARLERLLR